MKKWRLWLTVFLVVLVTFIVYKQLKGSIASWYFDNYVERPTTDPSNDLPDQICLTWSESPVNTQTIQWRTAPAVSDGWVQYRESSLPPDKVAETQAQRSEISDRLIKNDPVNNHFTAVVRDLRPATAYAYRVGSKQADKWSDWKEFTTAPDGPANFSFVYLGDSQLGEDAWTALLKQAFQQRPKAAFCYIAGDLVNSGGRRNLWDGFFEASQGVFERYPIVPTLGNHDYDHSESPKLYLDMFALPLNGPEGFPAEQAYSFRYGQALFVVLDANQDPSAQAPWLEKQLSNAKDVWKIALFHQPLYVSKPSRQNEEELKSWGPLFDKYHVDFALQGHDHAYLRTPPMNNGKKADSPKNGTYYAVTVSGPKYYEQGSFDYAEKAFSKVSTYQLIDIDTNPNRLTYRAYDASGTVRDEVIIEK